MKLNRIHGNSRISTFLKIFNVKNIKYTGFFIARSQGFTKIREKNICFEVEVFIVTKKVSSPTSYDSILGARVNH